MTRLVTLIEHQHLRYISYHEPSIKRALNIP